MFWRKEKSPDYWDSNPESPNTQLSRYTGSLTAKMAVNLLAPELFF
jgi:hypothetical protein